MQCHVRSPQITTNYVVQSIHLSIHIKMAGTAVSKITPLSFEHEFDFRNRLWTAARPPSNKHRTARESSRLEILGAT